MPAFVSKKVFEYDEPAEGLRVSLIFETFEGIGPLLWVEEHRGLVSAERARSLLSELHRRNLRRSWFAGFPGMFPVISWSRYSRQLQSVSSQQLSGTVASLPQGETPQETKRALL